MSDVEENELEEIIEMIDAQPGDFLSLTPWNRLECASADKQFIVNEMIDVYCMCIGRTISTTITGRTSLKIYFLTPMGVGYKQFKTSEDCQ